MMGIIILLIWISIVTSVSLFGAWYAKKYNRPDGIIGIYVAFVLISNLIAFKISEFDFGFTTLYATAASIIFPVTFLLTDVVNEKFGRKETQRMIFIAFIAQIATAIFILISIYMQPAPFWNNQEMFKAVFGFAPRIMIASWIAFLISENADAYIFAYFKKLTQGKHLWSRNVFSGIPAMTLDTLIFVTIGFYGIQPLTPLIIGVLVLKWIVGIVDIPFMYLNRWIMYRN